MAQKWYHDLTKLVLESKLTLMRRFMILSGLLSGIAVHVIAQVNVTPAIWMPKQYLEMRKAHPPKDDYWKSIDFTTILSPVSSLRVQQRQTSIQTYGTENFPLTIKNTLTTPNRTEWVLDKPVFNGVQAPLYEHVNFSLINHNSDPQDLWVGMTYADGRKDSMQFAPAEQATVEGSIWSHANNYLTYLFKGKKFDVYDHQKHLLYSNVTTGNDGKVNGLPGINEWNVLAGNTLQLTANTDDNVANYTITFSGESVDLKPVQATGILNQPLVLKEKQ